MQISLSFSDFFFQPQCIFLTSVFIGHILLYSFLIFPQCSLPCRFTVVTVFCIHPYQVQKLVINVVQRLYSHSLYFVSKYFFHQQAVLRIQSFSVQFSHLTHSLFNLFHISGAFSRKIFTYILKTNTTDLVFWENTQLLINSSRVILVLIYI